MKEYENVREALSDLLELNDSQRNHDLKVRLGDGEWHKCTAHDIQEFNYEILASMADLLGMSDLYLGGDNHDETV